MSAVLLSFAACSDHDEEPPLQPRPPATGGFVFTVGNPVPAAPGTLCVEVGATPSAAEATYLFGIVAAEDFASDAQAAASLVEEVRHAAAQKGAAFADLLCKGRSERMFEGLAAGAKYRLVAAYANAEGVLGGIAGRDLETPVEAPFTLEVGDVAPGTFTLRIRTNLPDGGNYYVGTAERAALEKQFGADMQAVARGFVELENRTGIDWSAVDNRYVFSGDATVDMGANWRLAARTEYLVVVFGVDAAGELTTEVVHTYATTAAVQPSSNVITFTVGSVTSTGALVQTRTTTNDTYFLDCMDRASLDAMGDERLIAYYQENMGAILDRMLTSGDGELDSRGMLYPDTEYYALAFGYETGTATTRVFKEPFRTLKEEPVVRVDCTFASVVKNITAKGATITVTPSDPEVPYYWDVFAREEVEAFGGDPEAIMTALLQQLADNYGLTLPALANMIRVKGENSYEYASLEEHTDHFVVAIGFDDLCRYTTEGYVSEKFTTGGSGPASSAQPLSRTAGATPSGIRAACRAVPLGRKSIGMSTVEMLKKGSTVVSVRAGQAGAMRPDAAEHVW